MVDMPNNKPRERRPALEGLQGVLFIKDSEKDVLSVMSASVMLEDLKFNYFSVLLVAAYVIWAVIAPFFLPDVTAYAVRSFTSIALIGALAFNYVYKKKSTNAYQQCTNLTVEEGEAFDKSAFGRKLAKAMKMASCAIYAYFGFFAVMSVSFVSLLFFSPVGSLEYITYCAYAGLSTLILVLLYYFMGKKSEKQNKIIRQGVLKLS